MSHPRALGSPSSSWLLLLAEPLRSLNPYIIFPEASFPLTTTPKSQVPQALAEGACWTPGSQTKEWRPILVLHQ